MKASVYAFIIAATDLLFGPTFSLAQNYCGTLGNSRETELCATFAHRFYLNTADPAPCTGYVTSWRVCYYAPDEEIESNPRVSYWATYAVYRLFEANTRNEQYVRVSSVNRAVRLNGSIRDRDNFGRRVGDGLVEKNDDFACYTDTLEGSAPHLYVQAGDLVGVCVFRPTNSNNFERYQLDVVGISDSSSDYIMEKEDDDCGIDDIPHSIFSSELNLKNRRRLHIYANIEPSQWPYYTEWPHYELSTTTSETEDADETEPLPSRSTTESDIKPTKISTTFFPDVTTTKEEIKDVSTHLDFTLPDNLDGLTGNNTVSFDEDTSKNSSVNITNFKHHSETNVKTAAISSVLVILLVALIGAAVVVAVFCILRHKKEDREYLSRRVIEQDNRSNQSAWDNVTYDMNQQSNCNNYEYSYASIHSPRAYETPVSTLDRGLESGVTDSPHNMPIVYKYATLGPNEETDGSRSQHYCYLDESMISYLKLLEKNKEEDIYGNVDEFHKPASVENELYAQLKAYGIRNIPADNIQINGHLGSGHFGCVKHGLWTKGTKTIQVALKLLRERANDIDTMKLLQEAAIMAQFKHPNVLALYGVVSREHPPMLVIQLSQKGDLRKHLFAIRPDPGELPRASLPNILLNYSQQVALGMHYLSSKGFVHRDLAARNILVSKHNILKVADFGMSRDLADETYYVSHGGKVPIKWTAPEAIHYKKYSTASDIWSYGCLLYEIWSLGHKPFKGIDNSKVIELVDSGVRLPPPPGCPRVIYELMINCWNPYNDHRPSFRDLLISLLNNPNEVTFIPPEALQSNHLAGVFCLPLEVADGLYTDLQHRYMHT